MHSDSPSLGWIQLTDLHAGQPKEGGRVSNIEDALIADLEHLIVVDGHHIDLVFFTGDIAFSGRDEEYFRATALLDRILVSIARFNGKLGARNTVAGAIENVPLLIPVPGNHDLQRPHPSKATQLREAFRTRKPGTAGFGEAGSEAQNIVWRSFEAYERWLDRHPLPFPMEMSRAGVMPGDCVATVCRNGVSVGVLGLNSAFLHLSDDDDGKLHIDLSQRGILGPNPARWAKRHHFTVLITHHPPASLSEASQRVLDEEIRPHKMFDLHLYGHTHAGGHDTSPGSVGVRHLIEGRSLFAAEEGHYQRMHGYTAGVFLLQELRSTDGKAIQQKRAEVWSRKGWCDSTGWHFGAVDSDWGRWRVSIELGEAPVANAKPATIPKTRYGHAIGSNYLRRAADDFNKQVDSEDAWISVSAPDYEKLIREVSGKRSWIFVSTSIPTVRGSPAEQQKHQHLVDCADPSKIKATLRQLTKRLVEAGYGIVIGNHPSIVGSVAPLALDHWDEEPCLVQFRDAAQWGRHREEIDLIAQMPSVRSVVVPEGIGSANSHDELRRRMLSFPGLTAVVFLGGLDGILTEFELAGKIPGIQRIAIGLGGGMSAELLLHKDPQIRNAACGRVKNISHLWHTPDTAVEAVVQALASPA